LNCPIPSPVCWKQAVAINRSGCLAGAGVKTDEIGTSQHHAESNFAPHNSRLVESRGLLSSQPPDAATPIPMPPPEMATLLLDAVSPCAGVSISEQSAPFGHTRGCNRLLRGDRTLRFVRRDVEVTCGRQVEAPPSTLEGGLFYSVRRGLGDTLHARAS
jgi:hypothetical protein